AETAVRDLSNNPLKNLERYEFGANTQLRKLMLANSELLRIDINISMPRNNHLIDLRGNIRIRKVNVISQFICRYPLQLYITSLCDITTRNCPFSGTELKRYTFGRWLERRNNSVFPSRLNCSKLHIITYSWTCEDDDKLVLNFECNDHF
ncbi:hypothetical protein GJ496_001087, partial [Pomphorhynchus laevis]